MHRYKRATGSIKYGGAWKLRTCMSWKTGEVKTIENFDAVAICLQISYDVKNLENKAIRVLKCFEK